MKTRREVKYGDSAYSLRFECPESWDIENLTSPYVKVRFDSTSSGDLLTSQNCTRIDIEALQTDALFGTRTISLGAAQAVELKPGDRIWINNGDDGPGEAVTVESYNATTFIATLESDLLFDHATGTACTALWVTYSADFSGSTYTKGYQFVITWEPQGTEDLDVREMATVASGGFYDIAFWGSLESRYPNVGTLVDPSRRDGLAELIRDDYRTELASYGFDVDRAMDSPLFQSGLQLYAHYKILTGGGNEWEYELGVAKTEWTEFIDRIRALEIWIDKDQDEALDDGEDKAGSFFYQEEDF